MADEITLRLRAVQSTLDLERGIAAATQARLDEALELLRIGAAQFREYERHHRAKGEEDEPKAIRNAALAERYEALLTRPTTTQGPV